MITAEDLSLAQSLLASGRVDAAEIEKALASLGGENSGKRLKEVLAARGLLPSDGAGTYGATLVPGSVVAVSPNPTAGSGTFDRTMMASGSRNPPPAPSNCISMASRMAASPSRSSTPRRLTSPLTAR